MFDVDSAVTVGADRKEAAITEGLEKVTTSPGAGQDGIRDVQWASSRPSSRHPGAVNRDQAQRRHQPTVGQRSEGRSLTVVDVCTGVR